MAVSAKTSMFAGPFLDAGNPITLLTVDYNVTKIYT